MKCLNPKKISNCREWQLEISIDGLETFLRNKDYLISVFISVKILELKGSLNLRILEKIRIEKKVLDIVIILDPFSEIYHKGPEHLL